MLALLAIALLAQSPHDHHTRVNLRAGNRKASVGLAFFEAFNSRGMGTFGACSTTAPTGAKGETLSFTRASSAVCNGNPLGGLSSTGIHNGDLVLLSSDQLRMEYDANGALMALIEPAGTNLLLRNIAIDNAAWADVGTPALTTGQTDPFGTTGAVLMNDDSGAAFEGRSQSITVSAGAAYFMHCYVKAGTSTKARISIDGTTQDISGLDTSSWSIIEKGDASSSGVSIPIQILVGNAVGDTGTVIWGGCDVKAGTYRTSIVPTAGATASRAADGPLTTSVALSGLASTGSAAVSITPLATTSLMGGVLIMNGSGRPLYFNASAQLDIYDGTTEVVIAGGPVAGTTKRYWTSWSGSTLTATNVTDGTANTGAFDGAMDTTGPLGLCHSAVIGSTGAYLCGRVCLDPSSTRCR